MVTFPSSPPTAVRADLAALRASLDGSGIPPTLLDRNLLIGTWKIRGFGKVLERWDSPAGDSPRRNFHDVLRLAEIISRFDVVALQEVMPTHPVIAAGLSSVATRPLGCNPAPMACEPYTAISLMSSR